mmetsp:Transcript_19022/g.24497  ORF Transcript_19022/g.24497 Transcript_19022/m.24497 type:complete len:96 (-) Transcript_19022:159-446(-)|eukprot:CAMPEP_0198136386 /NCGR_PEP_ID=MMETSP1443-20131203/46_1 /TAXON_ID=186043 /ORGANISM="Entomoneis sp., Strain CCMP2396" /LENGTH=95 /DNA_ID=CAMNT_0043797601 /DNA_START=128 /DNA_END=415 /DNA_ORIENTATION=+
MSISTILRQRQHLSRMAMPLQRHMSTTPSSSTSSSASTARPGAGLFQRLSSFIIGAGLTALVTQYYIFEELRTGNQEMLKKQKELETRLAKLEKK